MMDFITNNIGNIIITLALVGIVTLIVRSIIRDKKRGKSSCGGNCSSCAMCSSCHHK